MAYSGHSNVRRMRIGVGEGDSSSDFGLDFLRFTFLFGAAGSSLECCVGGSTACGPGLEGGSAAGGEAGGGGIGTSRAAGGLAALLEFPDVGRPCCIGRSTEVQNKGGGSVAAPCEAL